MVGGFYYDIIESSDHLWMERSKKNNENTMLDNHLYNLLLQMTTENKSLWRIRNNYKQDAGECPDCKSFWEKMDKDKEEHIAELRELIKKHI